MGRRIERGGFGKRKRRLRPAGEKSKDHAFQGVVVMVKGRRRIKILRLTRRKLISVRLLILWKIGSRKWLMKC